uniref:Uncharacterized protein n=1 Tax=Steinernema glaseri TaxID=37863 RepID=A0A1I7ZXF1_9BILA
MDFLVLSRQYTLGPVEFRKGKHIVSSKAKNRRTLKKTVFAEHIFSRHSSGYDPRGQDIVEPLGRPPSRGQVTKPEEVLRHLTFFFNAVDCEWAPSLKSAQIDRRREGAELVRLTGSFVFLWLLLMCTLDALHPRESPVSRAGLGVPESSSCVPFGIYVCPLKRFLL